MREQWTLDQLISVVPFYTLTFKFVFVTDLGKSVFVTNLDLIKIKYDFVTKTHLSRLTHPIHITLTATHPVGYHTQWHTYCTPQNNIYACHNMTQNLQGLNKNMNMEMTLKLYAGKSALSWNICLESEKKYHGWKRTEKTSKTMWIVFWVF